MRHRRRGRTLGRSPSHRKALLKNLASALFLTERDATYDENAPKVPGRITTTLQKAKEVRPLVEKCITIAKKSLAAAEQAEQYAPVALEGEEGRKWRKSEAGQKWRQSDDWQKWANARAPLVAARRRVIQLIGDKEAAEVLFETIAGRYVDRPGGYTRVLRLATPRLGDAGEQAILELVGKNDRIKRKAERPAFEDDEPNADEEESQVTEPEAATDDDNGSDEAAAEAKAEATEAEESSSEDKD